MNVARSSLVLALGFFALLAQTLLFRDFLTAFEGNELGIGSFFGSWFFWVAAGALIARWTPGLARRFVPLTLLYLPAFGLEHYLIVFARPLAGVASYELFPFETLFLLSFLTNAPVSFLTGFLFTLACRWWESEPAASGGPEAGSTHELFVARIYVFETLGAALGGVTVTAMLAGGVPAPTAWLVGAAVLATAAAVTPPRHAIRWLPPLALVAALVANLGSVWARQDARLAWRRLLPAETYRGRFVTAQADYHHGDRDGQFIVTSEGGVCETLPAAERGGEIAALTLAQNPRAKRVLVLGPGSLSICFALLELPSIERVTWLHSDPDYPTALGRVLPEAYRPRFDRLDIPHQDVRRHLESTSARYDLAILNLQDASTLVLNRYFTREFFERLASRLSEGGVAALRISGGANYLGGELAYLGASALATFQSVFAHVAIKPGDESWLLGSDRDRVTESPAVLRDRFAAIEGASRVYPPDGLLSLYLPDRIAFQREKYRAVQRRTDTALLTNTDDQPKALLYTLLVALKRSGATGLAGHASLLLHVGWWIAAGAIVLLALLRFVYRMRTPVGSDRFATAVVFDPGFLVLATGLAGMSLSIVLMFGYQSRYGSLFLHVGLVSALFMFGTFAGSVLLERWLGRRAEAPTGLVPVLLVAHLLVIGAIVVLLPTASAPVFGLLFGLTGFFTGVYFPVAAHRFRAAGRSALASGAALESLDHLGAAGGAVLTGLGLLPLFGSAWTAGLMALLVGTNLPPGFQARRAHRAPDPWERVVRPLGYALFGLGALALGASLIVSEARRGETARRLVDAARAMIGSAELEARAARTDRGATIVYFAGTDPEENAEALVFGTHGLATGSVGYGGPITLAVRITKKGVLEDYRILHSRETPAYLELVRPWKRKLIGRNLFEPEPFPDVDVVSGATLTSNALMRTLQSAARAFAVDALGLEPASAPPPAVVPRADPRFWWLAGFLVAAIALRFRPTRVTRRIFLLAVVVILGFYLNLQFASQHAFSLLSLELPALGASAAFFMVVVVPIATLLVGNVYCGYVCPFGAMQELVGELRDKAAATDPRWAVWRYGRMVKYLLLTLLAVAFAITRDYTVLAADPLTTFFGAGRGGATLLIALGALALSLPYRRFWCRGLCPAGAFLSLLNRFRLLRWLSPGTRPGRCDLGVRHDRELDCLRCDRCNHAKN
jgi:spermidine synthase